MVRKSATYHIPIRNEPISSNAPEIQTDILTSSDGQSSSTTITNTNSKYKEILKNRLPILKWIFTYTFSMFIQDLLAGFTVGLTEIPQGIAYAIVAGLPSQYGLYSGIMGGVIYFFFGGCKDLNMGPTAIMALFVQNSVHTMGPNAAILIAFLSGLLIFLAGILRLGFLVDFFSFPVISGFTTAAALSIASSQIKQLLGIPGPANAFLEAWILFFKNLEKARKWDSLLGCFTIISLFGLREIKKFGSINFRPEWSRNRNVIGKFLFFLSLAGNALAVISGTSIAFIAKNYYNSTPVMLTGDVTGGLPNFTLPPFSANFNGTSFSFTDMLHHYGSLLAFCPLVAFLEHIAIVKAFSKGKIVDATQELLALGLGNMAGSLVQSMPITGSFTRTAVNNASEVRTTTSGLITTFMLLISLALLTGIFKYIPKATLAAVIIVAMYYLCDFHAIAIMWRTKKLDLIPYFSTLICSLLISLEYGIIIGIGTSLAFILYDSSRPNFYFDKLVFNSNILVYLIRPKGKLHFPSAEYLRDKVLKECTEENGIIVIDGEFLKNIDGTVARTFQHLLDDLKVRNQQIIFWNFTTNLINICTGDNKKLIEHFRNGAIQDVIENYSCRIPLNNAEQE